MQMSIKFLICPIVNFLGNLKPVIVSIGAADRLWDILFMNTSDIFTKADGVVTLKYGVDDSSASFGSSLIYERIPLIALS